MHHTSQVGEHKEQAIAAVACAFVANTCGQPGLSLIFRDPGAVVRVCLATLACAAYTLHLVWPSLEKRLAGFSLLEPLNLVRRRFTLIAIGVVISIPPILWSRSWPVLAASPTRLVFVFPKDSPNPVERTSNNVHWSF